MRFFENNPLCTFFLRVHTPPQIIKMLKKSLINPAKWLFSLTNRSICASASRLKVEDKKMMLRSMPTKDEGIQGANIVDIDTIISK